MDMLDFFIEQTISLTQSSIVSQSVPEDAVMGETTDGISTNEPTSSKNATADLQALNDILNGFPKASNLSSGLDKIYQLEPQIHTQPILVLLLAHLQFLIIEKPSNLQEKWSELAPTLYWFSRNFNPETITSDLPNFFQLGIRIDKLLEPVDSSFSVSNLPTYMQITRIIQLLLTRANLGNLLTPIHSIALKYSIIAKVYRFALPLMQLDPTCLKFTKGLSNHEFYLYYYYTGLVYLNLGDYENSFQNLELLLFRPEKDNANSPTLSYIQQIAFRKYLLLGLIVFGKTPELPYQMRNCFREEVIPNIKVYQDICTYFSSGNMKKFGETITQSIFVSDGNLGLLKKCESAFVRQAIIKLPKFYCKVDLRDIKEILRNVPHPKVEELIFEMISQDRLQAEINNYQGSGKGMIVLEEKDMSQDNLSIQSIDEIAQFEKLLENSKQMDVLTEKSRDINYSIILNHSNSIKTARAQKSSRSHFRFQNMRGEWS